MVASVSQSRWGECIQSRCKELGLAKHKLCVVAVEFFANLQYADRIPTTEECYAIFDSLKTYANAFDLWSKPDPTTYLYEGGNMLAGAYSYKASYSGSDFTPKTVGSYGPEIYNERPEQYLRASLVGAFRRPGAMSINVVRAHVRGLPYESWCMGAWTGVTSINPTYWAPYLNMLLSYSTASLVSCSRGGPESRGAYEIPIPEGYPALKAEDEDPGDVWRFKNGALTNTLYLPPGFPNDDAPPAGCGY